MNSLTTMLNVTWKELIDISRDKRSLTNVFLMGALLGPLLAMGFLAMALQMVLDEAEKTLEVPTIGIEHAPELVRYLEQQDIILVPADNLEQRVMEQSDEVALRIPEDFADQMKAGKPVIIELIFDEVRTKSSVQRGRLAGAVSGFAREVGTLRLIARGIDPNVTRAALVRDVDVSTGTAGRGARILVMLPYFLIIGLIQASMFIASDVTAGERERQSLEPLLINPVEPGLIMGGKLLINVLVCIAVVVVSAGAFMLGTRALPVEEMGLVIDPMAIPWVLLALLPLVLVIAPLMTFLGAFAKSVREAQTYLSIVILIAILPSVAQMILQAKVVDWQLLIPLWSHNFIVNEIFRGAAVPLSSWIYSVSGSLAAGTVFTVLALVQYHQPKLIFNE